MNKDAFVPINSLTAKVGLAIGVVALVAIANHLFTSIRNSRALSKFPIANEKWDAEARKTFTESAADVIARGVALVISIIH